MFTAVKLQRFSVNSDLVLVCVVVNAQLQPLRTSDMT